MKPILYNKVFIISIIIIITLVVSSCCKNQSHGTFYISDQAKKYMPDTTIASFEMVDSYGITDGFFLNQAPAYKPYLIYTKFGEENRCGPEFIIESFTAEYQSIINSYFFTIAMMANPNQNTLQVRWSAIDYFEYDFDKKECILDLKSKVYFIDTLTIRGKLYTDLMVFDQTEIQAQTAPQTPLMFYFSKGVGLVKFETKSGIVVERK